MSEALKTLQEKIGATPDGAFGPNTARKICHHYALNPERGAHFLGQLVHESGTFRYVEEFLQCTGKNNYSQFAADMDLPEIIKDPDLVATKYPMESAIWFFHRNKLWEICDEGVNDETIKTITKRVNGGYNGLKHRKEETIKIYAWLT